MGTGILLPIQLSCKTVYVTFFECANQHQLGLDWKLPPAKDHFQKPVWMSATFLECKRVEKYRHRTSVPADTSESGLGTFTLLKLTQLLGISRELVQTHVISFANMGSQSDTSHLHLRSESLCLNFCFRHFCYTPSVVIPKFPASFKHLSAFFKQVQD